MNLCFGLFQLYLDYQLFSFRLSSEELSFHLFLSDKKALITMLWDTLWLFLTIIEVCGHTNDVAGMKAGCIIAFVFVLAAWLIFFDARYLNANRFIKSAIIVLIASVWTAFADDICEFLIFGTRQITIKYCEFFLTGLPISA